MTGREIRRVAVAGGGRMGRQIALNAAMHGFTVRVFEPAEAVRAELPEFAERYLSGRIQKGRMTESEGAEALKRFGIAGTLPEAAADADLLIEAVVEDREVKEEFFRTADLSAPGDCILASNSSYIPSSAFAGLVRNPGRLANLHYFNPALAMRVVEVVKGEHTSEETFERLIAFAEACGKTPVPVRKEIRGFVVNRILTAIRDEAYRLVEQGVAEPEDIDRAVRGALNHPMGVFELLDLTGIDLNYLSMEDRIRSGEPVPPGYAIAREKFEKHEWGRKTGKGFYTYPADR